MSQKSPFYILQDHAYIILKMVFLSLKIDFVFANSADPDEMQHFILIVIAILGVSSLKG